MTRPATHARGSSGKQAGKNLIYKLLRQKLDINL